MEVLIDPASPFWAVVRSLKNEGQHRVSARQLAARLLEEPSETGWGVDVKEVLGPLSPLEKGERLRRPEEWLAAVHGLYDPEHIPELDIPASVLGLALLDPLLLRHLHTSPLFDRLAEALPGPLESLLSEPGRDILNRVLPPDGGSTKSGKKNRRSPPPPTDHLEIVTDNALRNPADDRLGRASFARFLARTIDGLPAKEGSYAIHLYGPWGSGKSSMLHFIACELDPEHGERKRQAGSLWNHLDLTVRLAGDLLTTPLRWIATPRRSAPSSRGRKEGWRIVEFNAWRNQQVDPPWWLLLESVYRATRRDLSPFDHLREWSWRYTAGRGFSLLAVGLGLLILWLGATLGLPALLDTDTPETGSLATTWEWFGKIGAAVITLATALTTLATGSRRLSPAGAGEYLRSIHDPMNFVRDRFTTLVERLPYRLLIVVDDLDRCHSEYAVGLLEGIQTLLRDTSLVYLVAADRRWLNACYESLYPELRPWVCEPGKSLGTLFLEKCFQLSTPIPHVTAEQSERYWQSLIGMEREDLQERLEAMRREVSNEVGEIRDDMELQQRIVAEEDALRRLALTELAVEQITETDTRAHTEHALAPFHRLLDPNPRAMKRMVNAYQSNRVLAWLAGLQIDRAPLALWTILSLRWPRLADALATDPELLVKGTAGQEHGDGEIRDLLQDPAVRAVIDGKGVVSAGLTVEDLTTCGRLRI